MIELPDQLANLLRVAQERAQSPEMGLFGLSLSEDASLSWRGEPIEYHVYPQGWSHEMELEALRLAAACEQIEASGIKVSSPAVMRHFEALAFAPDMNVPRYAVAWSMSNKLEACRMLVSPIQSDDELDIEAAVERLKRDLMVNLRLDPRFVNGGHVCSSLQYKSVRVSIQMDMEWAARSMVMSDLARKVGHLYLEQLDSELAAKPPVDYWEIERVHLHPMMARIADVHGLSMECEADVTPVRERSRG